jgi:lipopolysaccharide export system protein LptA
MGRNLSFAAKALLASMLCCSMVAPVHAQAPDSALSPVAPKPAAKPVKKPVAKPLAKAAAQPAALSDAPKPAAAGPSLLPGGSSHEPINVAADKLDYFDKEQKLIYSGNVVAVQGESRLNATVLTILLDKKAPGAAAAPAGAGPAGNGVRRMEGKGPIAITSKDQVGTGDALVYDKPENKFYLIGNVALSQGENVTRGCKLVYDLTTGQAVVSSCDAGTPGGGRVHSLIIPGDQGAKGKPAAEKPSAKPAAPQPSQ